MARVPSSLPVAVALNPRSGAPLYQQLYGELRSSILGGHFAAGTQLPSTRQLAEELAVSRNTVVNAYAQLLAEGYLDGQGGSGTYVARRLPDHILAAQAMEREKAKVLQPRRLSLRGAGMAEVMLQRSPQSPVPVPFRSGIPALDAFPLRIWSRLMTHAWQKSASELLSYGDPAGYMPLRQAVAAYLHSARAVRCEARQVIIISGAQQGLDLTARLLLDPGDAVWLEDPGYQGARLAVAGGGAKVHAIPVDEDGLDVSAGRRICPRAKLVCVTPSHQFPSGVTMTLSRRLALLDWARQHNAWILEDDYDSEYRYASRPMPSLQGLDTAGHVVYLGTFSKVLYPSLRLGYLVVPLDLVGAFTAAKAVTDRQSPSVEQAVLAEFIQQGHFARHIRRMRKLYLERQAALLEIIRRELSDFLTVRHAEAGMHVVGLLAPGYSDVEVAARARRAGVEVVPLSTHFVRRSPPSGLLLGYSAFTPGQMKYAGGQLARVLRGMKDGK